MFNGLITIRPDDVFTFNPVTGEVLHYCYDEVVLVEDGYPIPVFDVRCIEVSREIELNKAFPFVEVDLPF